MSKKAAYKLIAVDLDRTLLNSGGELSERNRAALRRAMEAGVAVAPATGRAQSTLPDEILAMEGARYVICSNGAVIIDNASGEKIHELRMSAEAMASLEGTLADPRFMKEFFYGGKPYIDASYYRDMGAYGVAPDFLDYYRRTRIAVEDMGAFLADKKDKIEVVNLIFPSEEMRGELRERLAGNPLVEITSSLRFNLEIGAPGMNKGAALGILCGLMGVDRSEVIAFGDNDNDVTMIEFAGLGVAMGNATERAKAVADRVAPSNDEDGVAQVLEAELF
ncbi:MAG: Cof-type HAD-IIB family hydrolase [Clostridiales Family XIII bacterium]|jgi:Cof subfamily protein (haloacid dehalogenase superfamily)|nr:Cof-type HAD-IIB family hydrolase [Clostridiales Family XIII bacterium]